MGEKRDNLVLGVDLGGTKILSSGVITKKPLLCETQSPGKN